MNEYDRSLYYKRIHDGSYMNVDKNAPWIAGAIKPHLDIANEAQTLNMSFGFGFALGALCKSDYENTVDEAEIRWKNIDDISFGFNLTVIATKNA